MIKKTVVSGIVQISLVWLCYFFRIVSSQPHLVHSSNLCCGYSCTQLGLNSYNWRFAFDWPLYKHMLIQQN